MCAAFVVVAIRAVRGPLWLVLALLVAGSGCRTVTPYVPGDPATYRVAPGLARRSESEPQIERGQPRPVLDAVGWVIGIPGKIILWDHRIDNHHISEETERALAEYLAVNGLQAVKVRVNQYAPGDEWRRLRENTTVGAGWRYSLGTLAWLKYTLLPGRVFGGDNYNPFSNSIHLYSDVPATAIHEGGHAKDFAPRKHPGTYAAFYVIVPGAPLLVEHRATRDALSYLREHGTSAEEREALRILRPAYGTYVGSTLSNFTAAGPGLVVEAAAILGGHVVGRVQGARVEDERAAVRRALPPPATDPAASWSNPAPPPFAGPFPPPSGLAAPPTSR